MHKIHLFYSKNTGLHSVTHSIYIYICMCIYIYIYTYTYLHAHSMCERMRYTIFGRYVCLLKNVFALVHTYFHPCEHCIYAYTHIHSFIRLPSLPFHFNTCIQSFLLSLIHLCMHSLHGSIIRSFIHSFIHSFVHSVLHAFIRLNSPR